MAKDEKPQPKAKEPTATEIERAEQQKVQDTLDAAERERVSLIKVIRP